MSLPKYREYRDSGERWLGPVPAHWDVRRLKNLFEIRKRIVGEEGHQVLSITQRGIKIKDIESNDGQLSMDYSKYQVVNPGDFAMNHMDLLTGFVDISSHAGVTSPDYRVFAIRDRVVCEPKYFLYLLQNGYRQKIFYAFGQGASEFGRWRFPTDQFNDFRFPCPPHEEQIAIAAFLDRETTKIDALIAEQEKLIALLAQKHQATISHAVARGLNPIAPMKDSGVTWLGEIPAHWKVRRLRFIADIETGDADTANATDEGEYPFFVRSQTVERINRFTHDCEAVLTAGDGAGVGKVFHHFTGKFSAHQRVYIFKNFREVTGKWFFEYLKALFYRVVLEGTAKSTVDSLRRPMIANFPITVPSTEEMAVIERHIELNSVKLARLIKEAECGINLLKERRSALIAAAVTGQIDVRRVMPQRPVGQLDALAA